MIDYPKFSVLMSIYIKEKTEYFDECMKSIFRQTILPSEIVIVLDGPISELLRKSIEGYKKNYPELIKIIENKNNKGLGLALADGIPMCSYDLIARMDTDDIAREDRFEKQLRMFVENPSLDICGSNIIEFEGNINNVLSKRNVPTKHEEIVKYQKRRSAFNHMTVMYKKSTVLRAGNYEHCPLMEDDMLWVRMILAGARCANIDEYLVFARTGIAMIERRGGLAYLIKYVNGRKKIYNSGFIGVFDLIFTIVIQSVVALIPYKIRLYIFIHFLRKV